MLTAYKISKLLMFPQTVWSGVGFVVVLSVNNGGALMREAKTPSSQKTTSVGLSCSKVKTAQWVLTSDLLQHQCLTLHLIRWRNVPTNIPRQPFPLQGSGSTKFTDGRELLDTFNICEELRRDVSNLRVSSCPLF